MFWPQDHEKRLEQLEGKVAELEKRPAAGSGASTGAVAALNAELRPLIQQLTARVEALEAANRRR